MMDTSGSALFKNPDFDLVKFEKEMENRPAARSFGIFFTPRSGSSWLTDILSQTKLMGKPQEWFNPNFIPNISRAVNANSLDGYIEMLRRKHKSGGFFSFEVTFYQMRRVFGNNPSFLSWFPVTDPFFYLTREDIVLQAVSLAKAVNTSVFHSAGAKPEEVGRADTEFLYDASEIGRWLEHILDQEQKCERFFYNQELVPYRMTYERITSSGAEATARQMISILRPVKAPDLEIPKMTSVHQKIGSMRNHEYAERYRKECPSKIIEIEEFRNSISNGNRKYL